MPSDVGLVAKLVDSILHFVTDEDQLKETLKRMKLAKKNKEYHDAVTAARTDADFDRLKQLADELRALSSQA
jgi:hypothetical protein